MRPTDDVDCVVEVTSQREYYQLSATLRELGLSEDSSPGAPLCRWLLPFWHKSGINLATIVKRRGDWGTRRRGERNAMLISAA
jgi:hypothetical protein